MAQEPEAEQLATKRYITVVLRLVVDEHDRLLYGEIVDGAGAGAKRFAGWRVLVRTVRTWVARQIPPALPERDTPNPSDRSRDEPGGPTGNRL
ncbi:MAG: hypothetical protein EXR62_05210 [Chloroflexi bacterium]|nr:hypothetical protein [Chloroflexota bacterium]